MSLLQVPGSSLSFQAGTLFHSCRVSFYVIQRAFGFLLAAMVSKGWVAWMDAVEEGW